MDLSDALGDWPGANQSGGGQWPGQNNNPTWPGQPANPAWPGGQPANPMWPGAPSQPSQPAWPGQPSAPAQPSWPAQPAGPTPSPNFPVAPQTNLSVPFKQDFPSGLSDKMLITVAGTINAQANKFIVDFLAGSDIVFHFNPRFNESGRAVIVRNSEIQKQWGKEERELSYFPFKPGQSFEMKVLVTSACFKVAVNNSHLLEFKHRFPNLRAINRMNIYHDLTLSKVNLETLP